MSERTSTTRRISRLGLIAVSLLIVTSACSTASGTHHYDLVPAAAPAGTVGQPYDFKIFCNDPLGCELYELSLPDTEPAPPGLVLRCRPSPTGCLDEGNYGELWGIPTQPGTYTFQVDACSLSNNGSGFGSALDCGGTPESGPFNPDVFKAYTITINPTGTLPGPVYKQGPILDGYISAVDDAGDIAVVDFTVFVKTGDNWTQVATLNDPYGLSSVAISGDGKTIVLACCQGIGFGIAYVYVAPQDGWTSAPPQMPPTATLSPSNMPHTFSWGSSVTTDRAGDTIAVGQPCSTDGSGKLCGAVYVFATPMGGWTDRTEDAQLTISANASTNTTLGISVGIDSAGQTIAAGQVGVKTGAVHVFTKPSGGWATTSSPNATLTASSSLNNQLLGLTGVSLGHSVSISGDGTTVVAGAPGDGLPSPPNLTGGGATYVFVNPSAPANWTSQNEKIVLQNSNNSSGDHFGDATAVNRNGTTIVVGSELSPLNATQFPGPGEAFVFQMPSGGWTGNPKTETQSLISFPGFDVLGQSVRPEGNFGDSTKISLSGNGSILAITSLATVNGRSNRTAVYLFGLPSAVSPLTITTTALPDGAVGSTYSLQFAATGGNPPDSWRVVPAAGNVPSGLTLSASGVLTGTPTAAGTYTFDVQVTDSDSPSSTANASFKLVIASPVSITTTSLPGATVGQQYIAGIAASGGTPPYSWSLTAGSLLPAGLSLSSGGVINGTPLPAGIFHFAVQVTDSSNPPQSDTKDLSITVGAGTGTGYSGAGFLLIPYESGPETTPPLVAIDDNADTLVAVTTDVSLSYTTVFAKNSSGVWTSVSTLEPLYLSQTIAAAISGDGSIIAVTSLGCRCVYVVTRPAGGWLNMPPNFGHPLYLLQEANAVPGDKFGTALAIDYNGDTIAVGAPCDINFGNPSCGAAYVYTRPACGDWSDCQGGNGVGTETAALSVTMISGGVQVPVPTLGFSVGIDKIGHNIVAGAPGFEPNLSQTSTPGIAYLFNVPSGGWASWTAATNPPAKLFASDGVNGDMLGWSAAISSDGGTVVAGALTASFTASPVGGPGAAYVFLQPAGGWTSNHEDAKLNAAAGNSQDAFGAAVSVAANGSTIAVGAQDSPFTNGQAGPGAVFVYQIPATGWSGGAAQPLHQTQILTAYAGPILSPYPSLPVSGFGATEGVSMTSNGSNLAIGGVANENAPNSPPLLYEVVYLFH